MNYVHIRESKERNASWSLINLSDFVRSVNIPSGAKRLAANVGLCKHKEHSDALQVYAPCLLPSDSSRLAALPYYVQKAFANSIS
jgi:hypothetical protein